MPGNEKQNEPSKQSTQSNPSPNNYDKPEVTIFSSIGQFIDTQVSSALQSLIGIPSAMVNPSNPREGGSGGGRWLIYDEESRRRQEEEMKKWGGDSGNSADEAMNHASEDASTGLNKKDDGDDGGWGWWSRGSHSDRWHHRGCRRQHNTPDDSKQSNPIPESNSFPYRRQPRSDRGFPPPSTDVFGLFDMPGFIHSMLRPTPNSVPDAGSGSSLFHQLLRFDLPTHPFHDVFFEGPTWPLSYIIFSPYSPLQLEKSFPNPSKLCSTRNPPNTYWRDAFEDLLRINTGKELLDRSTASTAPQTNKQQETGSQWVRALVHRGSLSDWKLNSPDDHPKEMSSVIDGVTQAHRVVPPRINRSPETQEPMPPVPDFRKRQVEPSLPFPSITDFYEIWLGLSEFADEHNKHIPKPQFTPPTRTITPISPSGNVCIEEVNGVPTSVIQRSLPQGSEAFRRQDVTPQQTPATMREQQLQRQPRGAEKEAKEGEEKKKKQKSIIWTHQATTRTTLPDGRVQTKLVVKKRFADGREEVEETENTHLIPPSLDGTLRDQWEKKTNKAEYVGEMEDKENNELEKEKQKNNKNKGGWFWN